MKRLAALLLVVAASSCSTPLAQLRTELGPRASEELTCDEPKLTYKELDRFISSTRVRITGCGKEVTFRLVESRWERERTR